MPLERGYSVITGGGLAALEAANKGAPLHAVTAAHPVMASVPTAVMMRLSCSGEVDARRLYIIREIA